MKTKSDELLLHGNYAAFYMRLSREDENCGESASIATQRKILNAYAKDKCFTVYDEYVDDGFSGTNFDRPAFSRMLKDIELGRVNIVITKDLSRLGRNSARTSDLIDEYFPERRVRYISVNEGIDSANQSAALMVAPITNVVNELYARDISGKIRGAFDIKIKSGEYIGSFAPYGYQKDPQNKNHLIIDNESAEVIRRIFNSACQGYSPAQIAKELNNDGILTPALYRCQKFTYLNESDYTHRREWAASNVIKLLKNIVYLGHTAQGKNTKPSFKSKACIANPREEWIIVENTHEPIIDEETWNIVGRHLQSRTCKKDVGFTNIFSGLAKCADCGRNMSSVGTRKKGSPANLACGGYKLYGVKECTNHHIDYNVFYNVILEALRTLARLSKDEKEELVRQIKSESEKETKSTDNNAYSESVKKLDNINSKIEQLFDDKYSGRVPAEQFKKLYERYEKEQTVLSDKVARFNSICQYNVGADMVQREKKFRQLIEEYTEIQTLNQQLLFELIDHIEVGQGEVKRTEQGKVKTQKIKIYFRFQCQPKTMKIVV